MSNYFIRTWNCLSNIGIEQGMSPVEALKVRVLNQVAVVVAIGGILHLTRGIFYSYHYLSLNFALLLFPLSVFVFHYYKKYIIARVLIFTLLPLLLFCFHFLFGEKLKIDYAYLALILGVLIVFDRKSVKVAGTSLLLLFYAGGIYCTKTFGSPSENYLTIVDTFLTLAETTICIAIFLTSIYNELVRQKDMQISLNQQLKQRNLELEEVINQNQVKDKFFALVAHDLRTPLLSLGSVAKKVNYLLQRNRPEEVLLLGDSIELAVTAAHKLLDNLLGWAMVKVGQFPNHPSATPVMATIVDIFELFQIAAKTKGIKLNVDPSARDKLVWCDSNAFSTILRNLIDNAIKYSPHGGKVEIRCRLLAGEVAIQVKDDGAGIPPAKLENIFTLSGNKGNDGTSKEKGTGLGLVLCHELATMNKGTIRVSSKVGEGAEFEIVLPSAKSATSIA